MRLLVVDDDPVFRDEFIDVLDGEGHQVEGAASTLDAVARLAPGAFDAVFTDLRMPRFTGFDLLKELRRRAPATQAVLVTGQADDGTALEALRAGALDVLAKPFDFSALQYALTTLEEERAFRARVAPLDSMAAAHRKLRESSIDLAVLATDGAGSGAIRIDAGNPWPSVAAAVEFSRTRPNGGLMVRVDRRLLAGIGPSPTVTFVAKLRAGVPSTVRIAVGVDGSWLADDSVLALRAALAAGAVPPNLAPAVLPDVRHLLAELRGAPGRPSGPPSAPPRDAPRRRARLLARLADSGWTSTSAGETRLTDEGRRASEAIGELERQGESTATGDRCFQVDDPSPPPVRPVE